MMRGGKDYLTKDGGFVIPEATTVVVDGKRVAMREFLTSGFVGGRIVRQPDGKLAIETFKREG